ncbi:hypothetical protein DMO24_06000 [Modestobacter versicolor]|uniref:Uncharacterized protein n=1 Tax=Modestobacter versicolor TaxID=429133 RepID=A0A323VBQ1_9ACTN|nr:hypothetical protein DMO24_06000 [Modestobacter versicolor]
MLLVLVVLGLAAAAWARTASRGWGLAALGVVVVLAAIVLTVRPRPATRLPETGELEVGGRRVTGLVLPLRRPSGAQALGVAVLAVLFLGAAVVTFVTQRPAPPDAVFGMVLLAVFGVLFAVAALALWAASGRVPYVGLTPTHLLVFQETAQVEVPWSDLAGVAPVVARTGASPLPDAVGSWVAVRVRTGSPAASGVKLRGPASRVVTQVPGPTGTTTAALIGDVHWAVDPVLAWWTLSYYAEHPAERRELSGPAAVERVTAGDLR